MGGCRCSYRNCKSATKLNGDRHFFHYPVKHRERCNQWIMNAKRPEFCNLSDDQLRNKVVCDLHFEKKFFTNVLRKRLVHDAVPTIQHGCDDENITELKDVQLLPANDDGTIFTLNTGNMQQKCDNKPIPTYSLRNGVLVPVYSVEQSYTEQVLHTIDEEDLKPVSYLQQSGNESSNYLFIGPNKSEQASESFETVFDGDAEGSHISYKRKPRSHSPVLVENQHKTFMVNQSRSSLQGTMKVVYITKSGKHANSPVHVKADPAAITTEPPIKLRSTKSVKNKYKQKEPSQQMNHPMSSGVRSNSVLPSPHEYVSPLDMPQPPYKDPGSKHRPDMTLVSEQEFEDIMSRNRAVFSSTIARAVSDAAAGEYASTIYTLATAVSLIEQSKVANDDRCKILISSLQDTIRAVEDNTCAPGTIDKSSSRERYRRSRHERSLSRCRELSRDRKSGRGTDRDRDGYYAASYKERERQRGRDRSRSREGREWVRKGDYHDREKDYNDSEANDW